MERCANDQTPLVEMPELPAPLPDPLLGQILENRYRIDRVLGTGGMGSVYLAEHTITRERYAIKVMHRQLAADQAALRRFEREARAISAIDHPHVVEVYDYGQTPSGVPFLVMEYLEGATLRDCLQQIPGSGLPLNQAVSITRQAAQALQHVHECGIVHRDIKPPNIQLTVHDDKTVFVKLFDFGIARIQSQAAVTEIRTGPPSTLAYAAPEVHKSADYLSPAIDVYSLGITLFEMVAKERPFRGDGFDVVWAHLQEQPPRLSERRQDIKIPLRLEELTAQMLEKDAAKRPTMAQVATRLASIANELASEAARDLHSLRTFVMPTKQRDAAPGVPPPIPGATPESRTALQVIVSGRELDLIETERESTGAQLEAECRGMIKLYFSPEPPPELAALARRCGEIKASKTELEASLARHQQALANEQAAQRTRRNELRGQLRARRDELRAMPSTDPERARLAHELEEIERAYATPEPASATAAHVQQEGTRQQQLRAELILTQRTWAEQLLRTTQEYARAGKIKGVVRTEAAVKMATKQLAALLGQLDTLDASLREI
jgi:serine/threonine protein kinase